MHAARALLYTSLYYLLTQAFRSPFENLCNPVKVPWGVQTNDKMAGTYFDIGIECSGIYSLRRDCMFDLLRVASLFGTPVIENFYLVSVGGGIAEAVPDIGIFGSDAQRFLFASAANQNGNLASWFGIVNFPAVLNDLQCVLARRDDCQPCQSHSRIRCNRAQTSQHRYPE